MSREVLESCVYVETGGGGASLCACALFMILHGGVQHHYSCTSFIGTCIRAGRHNDAVKVWQMQCFVCTVQCVKGKAGSVLCSGRLVSKIVSVCEGPQSSDWDAASRNGFFGASKHNNGGIVFKTLLMIYSE